MDRSFNPTLIAMAAAKKVGLIKKNDNFLVLFPILQNIFGEDFLYISGYILPEKARNRGYQVDDSDLVEESLEDLFKQYKEKHNL